MYLDVPSIFSPYVRLELLKWDPLHQDVDFCDMKWHGLLFDNGKPEDEDDSETDDTDANLVSELVEKVAIPILTFVALGDSIDRVKSDVPRISLPPYRCVHNHHRSECLVAINCERFLSINSLICGILSEVRSNICPAFSIESIFRSQQCGK
ncbi:Transcriptional repressor ILP1 [Cardamine amara subsp. amara]|uniref:Transcriptional repressor ILP1 n=1 Tax=Cardamine amara subsp. amara TaxID=228776 RepID=A0ABD0ZNP6_CARAN